MIYDAMPEHEYHSRPELSSTQARQLLESPARYKYALTARRESSATFDLGSAVHARVLGVGWGIEELEFDSFRSKAAQEARDAAREAGLIPMLSKDLEQVHAMTEATLAHPTARVLFEEASGREVSVFSEVDGVPVRCRFDALGDPRDGGRIAVDLKTTLDASPGGFTRSVASYGYDVQAAHYEDTLEADGEERPRMVFICVEKAAPHLVAVHRLSALWEQMGAVKAQESRRLYRECTESGVWPGYPEEVHTLEPPAWSVVEHEEKYEQEAY
jgi:hypothetical protein